MEACLRAGRLKIAGFFPEVRVVAIDAAVLARYRAPEIAFMNVNTPEEYARAQALAAEVG
jgi:molybdopterin-guanine dinucleotide biosynthesis protein A